MSGGYEVGYGRPPMHTRFQPGQSGNPWGRPKAPLSLASDLREELEETVTLGDGATERSVSRQRAIIGILAAKAIEGDARAIEGDARAIAMVLDLTQRLAGALPDPEEEDAADRDARNRLAKKIVAMRNRLWAYERGEDPSDPSWRPPSYPDDDELESGP